MIEKCFIDYKCRCTCLKVTYRVYVTPAMKNGGNYVKLERAMKYFLIQTSSTASRASLS